VWPRTSITSRRCRPAHNSTLKNSKSALPTIQHSTFNIQQ
jgi:hypothetical protein